MTVWRVPPMYPIYTDVGRYPNSGIAMYTGELRHPIGAQWALPHWSATGAAFPPPTPTFRKKQMSYPDVIARRRRPLFFRWGLIRCRRCASHRSSGGNIPTLL